MEAERRGWIRPLWTCKAGIEITFGPPRKTTKKAEPTSRAVASPTELGWESDRIVRAWAKLIDRLGYTRYVAQGGDVGADFNVPLT